MATHTRRTEIAKFLRDVVQSGARLIRNGESIYLADASNDLETRFMSLADEIKATVFPRNTDDQRSIVHDLLGNCEIRYVMTDVAAIDAVNHLLDQAKESGCIAIDTETQVPKELQGPVEISLTKSGGIAARQPKDGAAGYALNFRKGKIRLIQASAGGDHIVLFDMNTVSVRAVMPLFHGDHGIAMFNASFDLKFFMAAGIEPTARIHDTQLAMRLLDPCEVWPISLEQTVKIILETDLPKELGASDWSTETLSTDQLKYAALDALATFEVWKVQQSVFDDADRNVCRIFDSTLIPVARMEMAGVPIDRVAHSDFIESWQSELQAAEEALSLATDGFLTKAPSPQEVRRWLDQILSTEQCQQWPQTPAGNALAVNKSTFATHGEGVPGLKEIASVTQWMKGLSTYGQNLADKVEDDDRLHARFLLCGSRTGRFSSQNPNLQNLPKRSKVFKKFRDIIKAPDGYLILSADYSQIELRQIAEISGDERMREAYFGYGRFHRDTIARQDYDIHRITAKGLDPNYDQLSKEDQDAVRSKAKGSNFGLSYGSGAKAFQVYLKAVIGVDVDLDEAKSIIDKFHMTYPDLAQWQEEQTQQSRKLGYVQTLGGRRWFWEWRAKDINDVPDSMEDFKIPAFLEGFERNFGLNLPVQGTCAEIMCRSITLIDEAIRGTGASLIATVHDEVVIQVPEDRGTVRRVRRLVIQKMTKAWLEFNPSAPWRGIVEVTLGETWGTPLPEAELQQIHRWL